MQRLEIAMNRKSVPMNARYRAGWSRPTPLICPWIPVTTISRIPCQREIFPSVASYRVISIAPTVIASIRAHVVTIVLLSTTKR